MRDALWLLLTVALAASEVKKPTVLVSVLVRNKAHTLPYFLSLLERQNYPKGRISLWIRSDHNVDNSLQILREWLDSVDGSYHSVSTEFLHGDKMFEEEKGIAHWSQQRFSHVIALRENALNFAREIWADYFLAIDADAFLTNPDTLAILTAKNLTVVAPMLKSDGLYSNFWHGMTDDYYYERTEDYKPVLNREKTGCFVVPMVHSCVLVDLRSSATDLLTYVPENVPNYDGPKDDIIAFAVSASRGEVELHVCNDKVFGFIMVPLEQEDTVEHDFLQLTNLKLEILHENEPMEANELLSRYTVMPEKDKMGFDEVYMINLVRRSDRRLRMLRCFDELGLEAKVVDAADGRALNETFLDSITFLPEYADPYHKRPMTMGEIGCFMSHYNIWKEIADEGYGCSLVLEDDIRFEPFFRIKVRNLMEEVHRLPDWDLVYFGRKRLQESDEPWVQGSKYLVEAGYSYWTLGYALSLRGARKLVNAQPLTKLLPVDEYLPILFDKHPQPAWMEHFPKRDLKAYSAAPLMLYPTHYTGETGYISDTENSIVLKDDVLTAKDEF